MSAQMTASSAIPLNLARGMLAPGLKAVTNLCDLLEQNVSVW